MRRVPGLLAALFLVAALFPASVLADKPQRFTESYTELFCESLEASAGTVLLDVAVSDDFGSFASMAIWAPGDDPYETPPIIVSESGTADLVGSSMTASFGLAEYVEPPTPEDPPFGDPAGTASLSAELTPVGDPETFSGTDRTGNSHVRYEETLQFYSVAGTMTLALSGAAPELLDLGGCQAVDVGSTYFATQPHAYVESSTAVSLSCSWETESGFVALFAVSDQYGAFSDLFVQVGDTAYSGFTEAMLTDTAFSAAWDLYQMPEEGTEAVGPGDVAGTATAEAILTRTGERVNLHERFGNAKFKALGWVLAVDGELSITLDGTTTSLAMDAVSCYADKVKSQFTQTKPSGRPLANDAPEDAASLAIGDSVSVKTAGAATDPEEPCLMQDPGSGEWFEIPFGKTGWWTVSGEGSSVTVDTAGSDFDTVVAVYTGEPGAFEPVGCVDDVFDEETGEASLQAAITFDAALGETYWIQAGGFDGLSGTLVLSAY